MVRDSWKRALKDAEDFLENARNSDSSGRVRVSNLVHAVIRANDSLLLKHGKEKPKDHEHASQKFNSLVQERGVFEKFGRYRKNIQDVLAEKTPAEYTGRKYRKSEVRDLIKKTERFVSAVKRLLGN